MFFKKFLNQPNLVGTVLIALMVCSGFVYAFAFDGFNVETATGGEVEAWLVDAGGGGSGEDTITCSPEVMATVIIICIVIRIQMVNWMILVSVPGSVQLATSVIGKVATGRNNNVIIQTAVTTTFLVQLSV